VKSNGKISASENRASGLSTFGGVFTPSILTILGVIMYLRFGWVVGNVGLIGTLLIVTLSTSITFLTSLSIASIATDQKVKIGGAYYMISRSLGLESGGAIGISLYFAQALSVALYAVGFAESLLEVFPNVDQKMAGMITVVGVAALALTSAKAAIRAQYVIMIGIAISLVSLVFGSPLEDSQIEMWGAPASESVPFWVVFAVFFPAVTGIMAGVGMSGDLKNAKKSIPRGTFLAIGVGYLIYMGLPIILASRADASTLIEDPMIMRRISFWGDAILLGVWGATLSSAVGSILGAPRVLQALAKDDVLPSFLKWMGKGAGKDDTPRLGTLFTLIIVLIAVWFGDLNMIAPVLTMFFLTTYGVLNVAAGLEKFLRSPSFRPTFKVHWSFSILGAVACIAVMFLINSLATIIALAFIALIYFLLKRRQLQSVWGNVGRGVRMAIIRATLLKLGEDRDPKNWRPQPIVFVGSPNRRWHLIELANTFTQKKGILTVGSIIPEGTIDTQQIGSMTQHVKDYLQKKGIEGLVKVIAAPNAYDGVSRLVEAYGLGSIQPNTIIVGATQKEEDKAEYCQMIQRFYQLQRNILIVHKGDEEVVFGDKKRIDVWWGGLKGNGGLMMILAYLMSHSIDWRRSTVHLKMVVDDERAISQAEENLIGILDEIRIQAEIDVIAANGKSFDSILLERSKGADLVFMGMATPDENFIEYYETAQRRIAGLPTTILALAAQDVSFGEVLISKDTMQEN
jgi:amino acid transporter